MIRRKIALVAAVVAALLVAGAPGVRAQLDKLKNTTIKGSEGPLVKIRHVRQLNEEKEGELKGLLTPPQFEKYLASKAEMRQKFEERMEEEKSGRGK